MNLKDKKKRKDKFYLFLEKIPNNLYSERWRKLFERGEKGQKKIDVWKAWEDNFSNSRKIEWNKNISYLFLHFNNLGITSFIFFGLGHNKIMSEKYSLQEIVKVLKENIEGIYIMNDDKTFLISNHDGDILIFSAS